MLKPNKRNKIQHSKSWSVRSRCLLRNENKIQLNTPLAFQTFLLTVTLKYTKHSAMLHLLLVTNLSRHYFVEIVNTAQIVHMWGQCLNIFSEVKNYDIYLTKIHTCRVYTVYKVQGCSIDAQMP